jgi:hypothetical protein
LQRVRGTITDLIIMGITIFESRGTAKQEHFEIVSGTVGDEIAMVSTGKNLLLHPIFVENAAGERGILCYVPQELSANENEPFTRMICELLRTGIQEAFPSGASVRVRSAQRLGSLLRFGRILTLFVVRVLNARTPLLNLLQALDRRGQNTSGSSINSRGTCPVVRRH